MATLPTSAGTASSGAAGKGPASTGPAHAGPAGADDAGGRLIGRQRELSALRELTAENRLVTLAGPAGSGKTRLLRALLPALAADYPDGTFVVDLGGLRQAGLVASDVAAALRVAEEPRSALADTLAQALRGRRLVLGLDGCEDMAAACGALCEQLLASAPGLLIVAASRTPLRAAGEETWPVPPLPPADAALLFADRAGAAGSSQPPGGEASDAVAEICAITSGLPLAIELAAARAATRSPRQIADVLADRVLSPAGDGPASAIRQCATMRAVIGWSHELLAVAEQVLLRRLSALGLWSVEAAEQVCADDSLPAAWVAGLLGSLAEKSLVVRAPAHRSLVRYQLPGAVRDFAGRRLAEAGEVPAMRRRVRDYAAHRAEYIASIGMARVPSTWPVHAKVFRDYDADVGELRAVLTGCLERGDIETGLRICAAVRFYWLVRGRLAEGTGWIDAFLRADISQVPADVHGCALVAAAYLAFGRGDLVLAQRHAAAGLEMCRVPDTRCAATAMDLLARIALAQGRPEEAVQRASEAMECTARSHDWWGRGYALGSLSAGLAALGRLAEAREWAEAGLALMLEIDNQWGVTLSRIGLGDLAGAAGDLAAARRYYADALPFARQYMGASPVARCLTCLAIIATRQGDLGPARAYLTESLERSMTAAHRRETVRALAAFAALARREGLTDRAVTLAAAEAALREDARLPARPHRREQYREAAGHLDDGQFERLWAAGLRLTAGEAAALAAEPGARLRGVLEDE